MALTTSNWMPQYGAARNKAKDALKKGTPASDIDWGLAAVCYFVGVLGIHRFMIGDTKNGILMLLTLGGCGIWALIDFINILMGNMSR